MVSDSSGNLREDKEVTIFGDGEQSRDFTCVENIVEANLLTIRAERMTDEVFNIAYGEQLTVNELARLLSETIGVPSELKPQFAPARPGDVRHSLADISKARTLLGYYPKITAREGFERTVKWYKLKLG
ncbi:GDP-mannose 4,6-dehydratase [Candidatus Bipolaricaulota bacterium]|nr:GDP-mannose 4,6-dehydratase [Candidatus Bipolaricaulota bacterium]